MAIATQQQLAEIIDVADVSVRVASQLRMAKQGRETSDEEALNRAKVFLTSAIEGGQFISTGQSDSLQSTLRPFNWAADANLPSTSSRQNAEDQLKEYKKLVEFLQKLSECLIQLENKNNTELDLNPAISFFQRLGDILGTRADQGMRSTSVRDV